MKYTLRKVLLISLHAILFFYIPAPASAQIIFPENFVVLLDSAKTFKGSFSPEIKIQTQKKLLVEINSLADLVFRIKTNSLTIAQKIEYTAFGNETALSGGYLYTKFKTNKNHNWMPEYFGQVQWADARGLSFKTALGANLRYAFFRDSKLGLFAGLGNFYEYEKWNYNSVEEERLPPDISPVAVHAVKLNLYLSGKKWITEKYFIDVSMYYQARFNELFQSPRLASSTAVSWQFSPYWQLGIQYQSIYDFKPLVPIDNWFHRFTTAFLVSF